MRAGLAKHNGEQHEGLLERELKWAVLTKASRTNILYFVPRYTQYI